ncbi:hypothetical protein L596_001728 [Steinernema carpocapsae]|uniref:Neurotransmitter-gated ion-channel transmembrane domain-containing protein n=1 Tax=Steinernema carpocapsae TaxID=34508 RepID=A0A4U8UM31_STECR|nr:hypothetical protein L596_001728 [Steinernema carpocapsae]
MFWNCTLTISSWTNSKSALDYYGDEEVNLQSYIPNEEWDVISFRVYRHEYKYACCPEPWVILEASIVIRRKPLYYVVNLIIPTSIITIVAITGFFTPASTSDDRTEKINLGITTLLAMSILMLMVSDQMPTTSEFVPLIAWFYLSIIIIVSIGTFLTSIVLSIQGRRQYGRLPPLIIRYLFFIQFVKWVCLSVPPQLLKIWEELDDHPNDCWIRKKKGVRNGQLIEPNGATRKRSMGSEKRHSAPREEQKEGEMLISPSADTDLLHPKKPSKKTVWLRASQRASTRCPPPLEEKGSLPMIDISTPTSPSSPDSGSRRPSRISMWDNAMMLVGLGDRGSTKDDQSLKTGMSIEMLAMKRKRQCSLEWEFMATILDRILLIMFSAAVVVVTLGMMVTGHMAQHYYDKVARDVISSPAPTSAPPPLAPSTTSPAPPSNSSFLY